MTVRDEATELMPGATAYVSGHVPQTFRNQSDDPARFLLLCSPGGFEDYFRAIVTGDEQMIAAVSERFGYRPVDSPDSGSSHTTWDSTTVAAISGTPGR